MKKLLVQDKREFGEHGMIWFVLKPERRQTYKQVMLAGITEGVEYFRNKYNNAPITVVELHIDAKQFEPDLEPLMTSLNIAIRYRTYGQTRDIFIVSDAGFDKLRQPDLLGD